MSEEHGVRVSSPRPEWQPVPQSWAAAHMLPLRPAEDGAGSPAELPQIHFCFTRFLLRWLVRPAPTFPAAGEVHLVGSFLVRNLPVAVREVLKEYLHLDLVILFLGIDLREVPG